MAHPYENWEYPKDFEGLVTKIGGQAQVDEVHYDREAFRRWKESSQARNSKRAREECDVSDEDNERKKLPGFSRNEQARESETKRARKDPGDDDLGGQLPEFSMEAQTRVGEVKRTRKESEDGDDDDDELAELSKEEFHHNLHIKSEVPEEEEGDQRV
ncbi:hypothetical protein P171DRAFT_479297 [Karstenula rhodostoma CBS 690.94]|uniref:Uncharacterized protein n=1 Tax=Karstenula rhodostoma CBS 690.94 TaxID=1392251 RepID=A0A9P4PRW9_9PLEO|nr:hypothetical protein P171DRAFT_479297 [Karstenula rhodostoma CBS 690.94]